MFLLNILELEKKSIDLKVSQSNDYSFVKKKIKIHICTLMLIFGMKSIISNNDAFTGAFTKEIPVTICFV